MTSLNHDMREAMRSHCTLSASCVPALWCFPCRAEKLCVSSGRR